jgi:hypothetical protein
VVRINLGAIVMAMSPERIAQSISFLKGEVHALFMFSQALAFAHPNPQALLSHLNQAAQLGLANIEPLLVSDALVEGYQFAFDGIRKAAEAAVEKSQNKENG